MWQFCPQERRDKADSVKQETDLLELCSCLAVLEMGYAKDDVKLAAQWCQMKRNGK